MRLPLSRRKLENGVALAADGRARERAKAREGFADKRSGKVMKGGKKTEAEEDRIQIRWRLFAKRSDGTGHGYGPNGAKTGSLWTLVQLDCGCRALACGHPHRQGNAFAASECTPN